MIAIAMANKIHNGPKGFGLLRNSTGTLHHEKGWNYLLLLCR